MVQPEFSEFQFGYGITRELEEYFSDRLICPPFIPSQHLEMELGSDAVLNLRWSMPPAYPLFLQYKRSDRMVRSTAKEWSIFNQKYYRFDIHTENQHNTLVDLDNKVGEACYVAPGFHNQYEYTEYHRSGSLANNSISISASRLERVNSDDHRYAYTTEPLRGAFLSEPRRIPPGFDLQAVILSILEEMDEYYPIQHLREVMRGYREEIIALHGIDIESQIYESENILEWLLLQQRFFREMVDTELVYLVEKT